MLLDVSTGNMHKRRSVDGNVQEQALPIPVQMFLWRQLRYTISFYANRSSSSTINLSRSVSNVDSVNDEIQHCLERDAQVKLFIEKEKKRLAINYYVARKDYIRVRIVV